MIDQVNQTLDKRYRLDALLGRGGMGSVFRGYDLELQRMVAVKVMHPHLARQPDCAERFLSARMRHPRMDQLAIARSTIPVGEAICYR